MTLILRSVGGLGVLLFGGLLVLLMAFPVGFERSAIGFTKAEVTRQVVTRYPDLAQAAVPEQIATGLNRLSDQLGIEQDRLTKTAQSDVPEMIGALVERYCTCGPPDPKAVAARAGALRAGMEARVADLGVDRTRLAKIVQGRYTDTIAALRQDLTIFLSINVLAFAAVLGTTFVARTRRHPVAVPAALMLVSTLVAAVIYVFGTNWFHAILFQNYAGFGYGAWVLLIFGFLADIVVNQARVTLKILSNLPSGLIPTC